MSIKSKRLNPVPFDDLKKMGVTPDEREDYLEVTQVNHNETPAQKLEKKKDEQEVHTEKNLDEQEAEFKKETNQKYDSLSEIEEKRLRRKIEVEKSIEAFEKSQAEKLRKKEFLAQVEKIKEASMSQLEIMREREKKYRVELEQALKENKDTSKISDNYIKDQQALLYNNDNMSMYLSMSTLDAEGNPNMSVKDHIFGRTAYGRQKSVLINGKPVMLDESVANAIQAERSPVLAGHLVDKDNDLSQNKEANYLVNPSQTKNITKELADYKIAFDDMINGLDKDRTEMTNLIKDAYPVADKLKYSYDDGMTYGSKEERNLDLRPRRALPKAALMWGIMYEQELLAYGRRLPKVNDNMVLAMHQYDDVYSY